MLKGDDCVPDSTAVAKSTSDAPAKDSTALAHDDDKAARASVGEGSAYDKEAVDAQLKRAAKQVKENCGSASDEDGNKNGPWGATSATIVLGRNGHVSDVSVPAPYSGKPVGDCVVRSFKKIQFPPYAGATDVSVSWDVTISQPKHK